MVLALSWSLLGCAPDPEPAPSPEPTSPTEATADTADTVSSESLFLTPPTLVTPGGGIGGARRLTVSATTPAELEVSVSGPEGERTTRWPAATDHVVPVVGFRPGVAYTVTAVLLAGGAREEHAFDLVGDPAPATGVPRFTLLARDTARMSPGYTLFTATSPGSEEAVAMLLDGEAVPVWWMPLDVRLGDLRLTDRGTLLGLGEFTIQELDWLGEVHATWVSHRPAEAGELRLEVDMVHHEVFPLPNGNLLTLAQEPVYVPAYPASTDDPTPVGPATVLDDPVVELDPGGAVVRTWSIADVLDTSRIGFDSLTLEEGGLDWAHANAVVPDLDESKVVSLRHQDAVIKLDADGQLVWILGDPAGWVPPWADRRLTAVGDLRWPYHPHAPELRRDADGLHVLMFDNANRGHTPYDPPPALVPASRLVEFRVDELAGTVEQTWAWEAPVEAPLRAFALGDADRLANGNVLGVWGLLSEEGGVSNPSRGRGLYTARIIEVEPASGDAVLDLRLYGDAPGFGWSVYRAQRVTAPLP